LLPINGEDSSADLSFFFLKKIKQMEEPLHYIKKKFSRLFNTPLGWLLADHLG